MFGWLKKAKEKINPPDMFDRIKKTTIDTKD